MRNGFMEYRVRGRSRVLVKTRSPAADCTAPVPGRREEKSLTLPPCKSEVLPAFSFLAAPRGAGCRPPCSP